MAQNLVLVACKIKLLLKKLKKNTMAIFSVLYFKKYSFNVRFIPHNLLFRMNLLHITVYSKEMAFSGVYFKKLLCHNVHTFLEN